MAELCIVIPTYNERENISHLIPAIQEILTRSQIDGSVLVVDDNSPDGTAQLVEELSHIHDNIHLHTRPSKQGLGSAYKDGFTYAIERLNSKILMQMDADFSHDPKYIPDFLAKLREGYDIVLGSRNVAGGNILGWNYRRKLTSWVARTLSRTVAGVNVNDTTTGYRAYTAQALERISLSKVGSSGYSYQIEILFWAQRTGLKIAELPITFINRRSAQSKLGFKEIILFLNTCLTLLSKRLH